MKSTHFPGCHQASRTAEWIRPEDSYWHNAGAECGW